MKFVISLLLISSVARANPIHIFHENNLELTLALVETLEKEYRIPSGLISISGGKCQESHRRGKLDMCINDNGDLNVVSVDKNFIESIRIFRAP
jgi:hypothetical protein